jgi:hypothetical protein
VGIIEQIFGLAHWETKDFVIIALGAAGAATFMIWVKLRHPYL